MNEENLKLAQVSVRVFEQLIEPNQTAIVSEIGWDILSIENFIYNLSLMDTNNFQNKIGVGERESRIYSQVVQKKNYYMGHGIGRSGDVGSIQPKAAGSSLIYKIAQYLVKDAISHMGYQFANHLIILPLATGMSLSLSLLTLKKIKPTPKYVIFPRIDQKTCLKCIITANLVPIVIENVIEGQEIRTNLDEIKVQIDKLGKDNILCVLSTSSCFAARGMDKIQEISQICKEFEIFHICNNAYGLQSFKIANEINLAMKNGNLDLVVQSTDKNFMVPVGGSIVFSQNEQLVQKISENYPGRANSSPIFDMFVTLLEMGKQNLISLMTDRKDLFKYAFEKLNDFCSKNDFVLINTPNNQISIGIYLKKYQDQTQITLLGSILYKTRVMGCRIVSKSQSQKINGFEFQNYGSHIEDYPYLPYLTVAIAIGMQKQEVDLFIIKLEQSLKQFDKKIKKLK